MRQFKKHIIKAEDVNPLVVYLVNDKPVRVVCTDERGWKRGSVKLVESNYGFLATVRTFNNTFFTVALQCEEKDFYFCDASGYASLWKVPENWVAEETRKLQKKVDEIAALTVILEKAALAIDCVRDLQFPRENNERT
jgi:hypothetical protein